MHPSNTVENRAEVSNALNTSTRKPLLTPDEFREGLSNTVGRNSIYGLLEAGKIKSIRVGRKILIPASELTEFLVREAA